MEAPRPDLNSWEEGSRTPAFARDAELERILELLNTRLAHGKADAAADGGAYPMVFIVGAIRSGTTLLLQWLADTGVFCYPTNILSRFYGDPTTGALVQRALHDLDARGEIFPEAPVVEPFRSELGRARGPVAAHDFGYFWKSYFSFGATQAELRRMPDEARLRELVSDLEGVRAVFGKPMAMKAMQLNWHLGILARLFPTAIFLFSRRDIVENALSILEARRLYGGSETTWYSFKPAEYDRIRHLPPLQQALAQVHYTNKAIERSMPLLPEGALLHWPHEQFCEAPGLYFDKLMDRLAIQGTYAGPARFTVSRRPVDRLVREEALAFVQGLDG